METMKTTHRTTTTHKAAMREQRPKTITMGIRMRGTLIPRTVELETPMIQMILPLDLFFPIPMKTLKKMMGANRLKNLGPRNQRLMKNSNGRSVISYSVL